MITFLFFSLSTEKKSEVKEDEVLLDEEDPPITDDQTYELRAQRYSAHTHTHTAGNANEAFFLQ